MNPLPLPSRRSPDTPTDPTEYASRLVPLCLKIALYLLLSLYLFQAATTFIAYPLLAEWPFLLWIVRNSIFLFIHEGGHALFMPFGRILHALGGSFWQIVFPLISFFIALRNRSHVIGPFALFWTGANMLDVSLYVRDAPLRILPLLGNRKEGHDWHFLLNQFGWMEGAEPLADALYALGFLLCLLSLLGGAFLAIRRFRYPEAWGDEPASG